MVFSHSDPLRPILLEVLGEALKAEVHGTASTYRTITLSQGSIVPSDALARMRAEAIGLLTELYRTASSEAEKRRTQTALFEAIYTPSGSGYANELLVIILDNSAAIMDFFSSIAGSESYELLQTVEHKALWLYQRNQGIPAVMGANDAMANARDVLNLSIMRFRDATNANKGFTIYKTLVGFESVFPPAWDDPNFGYQQEEAYRERRVDEFVAEVNETNADDWFAIIQRCAPTESSDLATFP